MLLDPKSETDLDGKMAGEPARGASRSARLLVLALVACALGAGAYRVLVGPFGAKSAPTAAEKVQLLVREGERVIVPEGSPLRARLAIAPVAEQDIKRSLILPAVVEADPGRLIKVLPPLAGRVTQLKVQLGERGSRSTARRHRLARPRRRLCRPRSRQGACCRSRSRAATASATWSRSAAPPTRSAAGGTDYVTAEVELKRAEARPKQIGRGRDHQQVAHGNGDRADGGSIIDLTVAPGAYWNDATAALMTVADLRTVWVTASVPEKDTALVAKGQAVDVTFPAYPNETFRGEVLFVSDVLDPDTRRTKVRIAFDNPGTRLKPGMFANVSFYTPMQRVPVVPTTALVLKEDTNQVFVEIEPWTFEARTVEPSFQQGEQVVLKAGLSAGERIVTTGAECCSD
jgi:cobalt-zinc-cadmium efflux system membrane fusion protein